MNSQRKENTLFLGNGFSRSVFCNMPSWSELFHDLDSAVENYAILYEEYFLKKRAEGKTEEIVKKELVECIGETFSRKGKDVEINKNAQQVNEFGEYLKRNNINNIITTNYDNGIEYILCELCGYEEIVPKDMVEEKIYSIRTYRMFVNRETGHEVKLWKIHGDLNRIQSITLGYDQYCGALSKISDYIKGTYKSSKSGKVIKYGGEMRKKCELQTFDDLSWIELLFKTNVYIVGFGLAFSEIDIWWLLNKRARLMNDIDKIDNKVIYLYDERFQKLKDDKGKEIALFEALKAFRVECYPLRVGSDYIESIFTVIGARNH